MNLDEHPIEGNIGALASGKKYNELSYEEKLATREYVDHRRVENADIRAETENILLKGEKSTYIKWAAHKAQDGLQWYAEFAAKHPTLARWGFSVVNAVVETILAGPGGAINAVRSEIGGAVLDKVAGGEIEAVFTAVTHKGAGLLQEKNPELTYGEAVALATLGTIATISAGSSLASKIGPILKKWDFKHIKKPAGVNVYETPGTHGGVDVSDLGEVAKSHDNVVKYTPEIKTQLTEALKTGDPNTIVDALVKNTGWQVDKQILEKIPESLRKTGGQLANSFESKTNPTPGIRFISGKNSQYDVRIMKGDPTKQWPSQQQDYVKVVSNGKVIGKDGNPIIEQNGIKTADLEEAHIPLEEYKYWKEFDKK
ncbi:hypothetical protein MIDIC_240069 [Alphaproteobacteria bacterium]